MAEFPYLPLATDAYLADTTHLSTEEHGAYLLMLMAAWRASECRLPDNDAYLARVCRCSARAWARIRPVLAPFWHIAGGWWSQKRLSREREYVDGVREKRRNAAHAKHRKDKGAASAHAGANALHPHFTTQKKETEAIASSKKAPAEPSPPAVGPARKTSRATGFPEGFALTDERRRYAEGKVPGIDAQAEFERFRDHHVAKGNTMKSWDAAWRTWIGTPYQKLMLGRSNGSERRDGPKPFNSWCDAHDELIDMYKRRGDYYGEPEDEPGTYPGLPRKAQSLM